MAELQICLLGSFQVCWDFAPVASAAWRNPWALRLLKLVLAQRPDPVPAAEAVRLIGSGIRPGDIAPAIESVSRVLQPAAALVADTDGITFRPGSACWIDVDMLMAHCQNAIAAANRGEMFPAILAFQEADALYQGDFLEEVQDAWALPQRRRLQSIYTDILERLAEGHAVLARYQDAVGFCHKALAHDRLKESTYQRMMVYYYYLGDLAGASEAYQVCRYALQDAGRQVSAETVDLWRQLSQCELPLPPGVTAAPAQQSRRHRPRV